MPDRWQILLVDDDPDYHEIFQDLLDLALPSGRFDLTCVTDIPTALHAAGNFAFDVAVVDYRLGARTGVDLVAQLAQNEIVMPVILLTGHDAERATDEGIAVGARDLLPKSELSPRNVRRSLSFAIDGHRRDLVLRQAIAQMQRIEAGHAHFLSRMGHELRTPLNIIMGYAQILAASSIEPERVPELARNILSGGQRLADMVENVLALTGDGLDGGRNDETIDLAEWIELLSLPFRREGAVRGIAIEISLDGHHGFVSDRDLLALAIRPVLSNAVKFSDRDGQVQVTVDAGACLTVTIRDRGIGMDEAALALAQAPFFQHDQSSTRPYEGAGLGLTVARSAIAALGGRLTLESTPGIGTTAIVSIPAADQARVAAE